VDTVKDADASIHQEPAVWFVIGFVAVLTWRFVVGDQPELTVAVSRRWRWGLCVVLFVVFLVAKCACARATERRRRRAVGA
jgi:hypothetical protein